MLQKIALISWGLKNVGTISKQIIACAIMFLFLFAQVGKALHTHSSETLPYNTEQSIAHDVMVEKNNHCAICDYQVSSFEPNTPLFELEMLQHLADKNPEQFDTRITTSIGLSYSDRGPPSLS